MMFFRRPRFWCLMFLVEMGVSTSWVFQTEDVDTRCLSCGFSSWPFKTAGFPCAVLLVFHPRFGWSLSSQSIHTEQKVRRNKLYSCRTFERWTQKGALQLKRRWLHLRQVVDIAQHLLSSALQGAALGKLSCNMVNLPEPPNFQRSIDWTIGCIMSHVILLDTVLLAMPLSFSCSIISLYHPTSSF